MKSIEKRLDNNYSISICTKHDLEAKPHKTVAVRSPTTHHENYPT